MSVVSNLFSFKMEENHIHSNGGLFITYKDIGLLQNIGEFKIGTVIPTAIIDVDVHRLTLIDSNGKQHIFNLQYAIA